MLNSQQTVNLTHDDGSVSTVDMKVYQMLSMLSNELKRHKQASSIANRDCNICNYHGPFSFFGRPARIDALCPNCRSVERHRLFMLAIQRGEIFSGADEKTSILHFAAEPFLEKYFRANFPKYNTADLYLKADLKLNMEALDLPDEYCDVVIANHVLEHVDDQKAAHEIARILKKDGVLICMVPIIEGWDTTYEKPDAVTEQQRLLHFGQGDHVRYYGRDFRERIAQGGLELFKEITSKGEDVVKYGLSRGDKVFVFKKTN